MYDVLLNPIPNISLFFIFQIHKNIQRNKTGDGNGDGPEVTKDGDDINGFDSDEDDDSDTGYSERERPYLTKDGRDPMDIAMHIPGELKKIQNKITTREMEKKLTQDQREEEAKWV